MMVYGVILEGALRSLLQTSEYRALWTPMAVLHLANYLSNSAVAACVRVRVGAALTLSGQEEEEAMRAFTV